MVTPNNPQAANRSRSRLSILARVTKGISIQKSMTAPITLNRIKTVGDRKTGITPFANTWLAP